MSGPAPRSVLLAGGGTAGHVNPLLATADCLSRRHPETRITVLGTAEGLEANLVPARGYQLRTIPKVPMPRRPSRAALGFPGTLGTALRATRQVLTEVQADVVVGFGGYVSTPAYLAARRTGTPIVIHEQNARPGLANRLGARMTRYVATTFPSTKLANSTVLGLPLWSGIADLDRQARREEALAHFGLRTGLPTLLVFGGSLGALRLNTAVSAAASDLAAAGVQVLHLTGAGKEVTLPDATASAGVEGADGGGSGPAPPYVTRPYTDRMDLAYAAADLAVCRAGAGTVSELAALGLPAVYVPLPIGNGEQALNAADVVAAGGGMTFPDADFDASVVRDVVLPLLQREEELARMSAAAAVSGRRDADEALVDMVLAAARGEAYWGPA